MSRLSALELARCIRHSLSRFLSIAAIMALGVGFYAGLRMAAPEMRSSADQYFSEQQLYDLRIISNAGIERTQINKLEAIDGVGKVMPCYEQDALAQVGESFFSLRVQSFDFTAFQDPQLRDMLLNKPKLVEGRLPEQADECVLGAGALESLGLKIGDRISLLPRSSELDNLLEEQAFTIVGAVENPSYPSKNLLGFTRVGSGTLQAYCMVLPSAFKPGIPYTEAFVSLNSNHAQLSQEAEYNQELNTLADRIKQKLPDLETSRLKELQETARARLDTQWAQFNTQRTQTLTNFERMASQLNETERTQVSSQAEIQSEKSSVEAGLKELQDKNDELDRGFYQQKQAVDRMRSMISSLKTQAAQIQGAIAQNQKEIAEKKAEQIKLEKQLRELAEELGRKKQELESLNPQDPRYQELVQKCAQLQTEIEQGQKSSAEISHKLTELEKIKQSQSNESASLKTQIQDLTQQINERTQALEAQKMQATTGLSKSQAGLTYAQERLIYAEQLLKSGELQLGQAKQEFLKSQEQALRSLNEGQHKLEEAERRIQELDKPVWHVLDRDKNAGLLSYKEDAQRLDQIAQIFPLFFFLVAALVALTTMTRMVEEERIYIGTRKALGFSSLSIAGKYLSYALLAAGIGGLAGLYIFSQSIPRIIHEAYATNYTIPSVLIAPSLSITLSSLGAGLGSALLATFVCVQASLKEVPAHLMLPRSPLAGKRILLERLPLWRLFNFSWKVSLRNILRDKRRLSMTLVGVAGCTALLLTGMGLNDAISGIIERQYRHVEHFDAELTLKPEVKTEDLKGFHELLEDKSVVAAFCPIASENLLAQEPDHQDMSVRLICPENTLDFKGFMSLNPRSGSPDIELNDHALIVTQKLADTCNLKVGSQIHLRHQDLVGNPTGKDLVGLVTGICENYVGNKVIVGAATYQQLTGIHPSYADYLVKLQDNASAQDKLLSHVKEIAVIETTSFSSDMVKNYEKNLESVHMVVALLVVAAASLAAIVLYNLNNINISERAREVATLKVLGFTPREVNAYIFREVMLLCFGGALAGLVLGSILEAFVVATAETDQLMFVREISVPSFLVSVALTLVFGVLVNLMLRRKLKQIDMVESLKSVE